MESDFGAWTDPWPMVAGWVLLCATFVIAVALLLSFLASVTDEDGGDD